MEITIGFGNYELPKTKRDGKGKSCIAFPERYCVVDVETTGLSPKWDNIIEIGAIRYLDGVEVGRFQSLVQPPDSYEGVYIDDFITQLTGITNEMLANAPSEYDVINAFAEFLGNDVIIGYNVGFDINFLYDSYVEHLGHPLSNDYIDIMRFSRKLYPEMAHHRLCDMIERFGISNKQAHRALADVETTKICYERMHDEALFQYETEKAFKRAFQKYGEDIKAKDIIGDETKINPDSPIYKKRCVFTGKLEKFTRVQAMQVVADLGGINEDRVTKNTNFLILGNNDYCSTIKDGKSSKQKKAEKNKLAGQDIEIVPETVFYDMLGE